MRRRNFNLDLRLLPPTTAPFVSSDYSSPSMLDMLSGTPKEEQQLTILYNGQIAVCEVTELQARAIASREIEERSRSPSPSTEPSSPLLQYSPLYSPTAGLSMKRSLQRSLQKRKNRIQATFPYHHHQQRL